MLGQDNNRVWARYYAFLAISMAIIVLNLYLSSIFAPQSQGEKNPLAQSAAKDDVKTKADEPPPVLGAQSPDRVEEPKIAEEAQDSQKPTPEPQKEAASSEQPESIPKAPLRYLTLGSLEPDGPYRMLVTLSSRGAAIVSIEMSSLRYCDTEQPGGYLGEIAVDPPVGEDGVRVDVVGPGTPAALSLIHI